MPVKSRARKRKTKRLENEQGTSEQQSQQKPIVEENVAKFVSEFAEERYAQVTCQRALSSEKGFLYQRSHTLGYSEYIYSVILRNGWETFCQHPSAAVVPLVREFYANIDENEPNVVYVRGRQVAIDGNAINRLFNLQTIEDDLTAFADTFDEEQLDGLLTSLCEEGASWTQSDRGAMTFPR